MLKHLQTILFIALAILCFSCDKGPEPENYLVTQINETPWNTQARIVLDPATDTLTISAFQLDRSLRIKLKYKGEGRYKLPKMNVKYETLVGGDVLTGAYSLNAQNAAAELIITNHEEEENTLKGTFSFDVKGRKSGNNNVEETLRFTSGVFKGKVTTDLGPVLW